jgi:hypothetical protein
MANMSLRIRLGPLVYFEVDGDNCAELANALDGFEELNAKVDAMCSDLAERVYPTAGDGDEPPPWYQRGEESAS